MSYLVELTLEDKTKSYWNSFSNGTLGVSQNAGETYVKLRDAQKVVRELITLGHEACVVESNESDPTILFNEYHDLALKVASRFSRLWGDKKNYQDLAVSHLSLLILEKWDDYDSQRSRRTTWIYNSIYWHLQKTAIRQSWLREKALSETTLLLKNSGSSIDELVSLMSSDAAQIVALIRHDPDDLIKKFRLPKEHRLLQEHLVQYHDFTWARIFAAWTELSEIFQDM